MQISLVIPAHNEAAHLRACLNSLVAQTHPPDDVILVDDNSTDTTFAIALEYAQKYPWIKAVQRQSAVEHRPGKKVVAAFNFGLQHSAPCELIGKFDGDIVLPYNYFESMLQYFHEHKNLGMCSGILYVKKGEKWVYEDIAAPTHIRGPVKLYRRTCFAAIGGLRPGVGWDTVDVLLAHYHGFATFTDPSLRVKHLRPTGQGYSAKSYQAKGTALYAMRYGRVLTLLAALKMAWKARSIGLYFQILIGYLKAVIHKPARFVTVAEGRFIRRYRWKTIKKSLTIKGSTKVSSQEDHAFGPGNRQE